MQFSKNRHRFYSAWLSDQSSGNRNLFIFSAISSPVRRLCKPLRLLLVFLKVIFLIIWQPPAFPYRHQYSIIGRFRLNHRVRDVDGCFPKAHRHQKYDVIYSGLSLVLITRSITLPLHLARVIRPIRLRFHSILLINQRLSCLLIRQSSLITKQWTISTRFP